MSKPIKKISFILFLIILLPVLFFSFREISTLNENENILEEIYTNQLDAILFSVNQYSEDVIRNWSFNIENALDNETKHHEEFRKWMNDYYMQNNSLDMVFVSDKEFANIKVYYGESKNTTPNNKINPSDILIANRTIIERLYKYESAGFNKIEPHATGYDTGKEFLIFILSDKKICGLGIDSKKFINQILASKIQSVAREEFDVAVFDSSDSKTIYSIGRAEGKFQISKRLWLFPNYSLGIKLRGTTIEQLIKERTYNNLLMLGVLTFLMLIAAWFGYRNIKKEVELAQIRSDFVSNVSHELRTPLALINMFAETLSLGRVKTEDKRNEYYNIIQQETERLSKIVNKILSFSKIEAGKWKYNFAKADLNNVVEKIYNTYKFHMQNNGFEFIFEKSNVSLEFVFDSDSVSEAVINLLDNAVKYSADNKKIILRTGIEYESCFVEVEDNGLGISKEDREKIFDKFYRITSGDVHNTKGTGLGLTLVKHIADAHKGFVNLTSEVGKGSKFRMTFPLNNKS